MEDKIIDIDRIKEFLKRRVWIVIIITLCTSLLGVYKSTFMNVSYRASAKVFVGKGDNLMDYYSQGEVQYYTEFMNAFSEIVRLDDFLSKTLEKHDIEKSPGEVKNKLSFSASENTPIFTINYQCNDRNDAEIVLNAVCEEFNEQAKLIFPDRKPRIIDSVKVFSIYPNKKRIIELYLAGGFILSMALVLILDYLDDKVRTKKKLEKLLPVPVIGEIPKHERGFKEDRIC